MLVLLLGCEGCRPDSAETDEEAAGNQADEPFFQEAAQPFPSADQAAQYAVKPGHWFTGSKPLRSNRSDMRGDLEILTGTLQTQNGRVSGAPGPLQASRPAVLPKGQRKRLDFRLLAAIPASADTRRAFLRDRFVSSTQGLSYDSGESPLSALPPEEYFFLVLTTRPGDFVSLQVADWVSPPSNALLDGRRHSNYRVVFPTGDNLLPLPETMLDWTSTAFVLWDDISPDRLTPAQLQAMRDWVHWGGRMIVNGPGAGQQLANSKLADVLPMTVQRAVELDGVRFGEMIEQWSVAKDDTRATQVALAEESSSRVAIDGALHSSTEPIDQTAELVLERRVGLGNVVMTRFDLTSKILLNWRSVQSFYNNALLRHPPRQFVEDPAAPQLLRYVGGSSPGGSSPLLNSSVRFFSRDGILASLADGGSSAEDPAERAVTIADQQGPALWQWQAPGALSHPLTGAAAWTDRSAAASVMLRLLREEAGIVIPPATFVAKSLLGYLVVLVPLNFLVFRLLNRLEWAWLAVPVLSIAGAVWVARAARLDIGFARSHSEIGLLEMQPGHQRAHLTSYIALYNSLSSTYRMDFETSDAAAAPVQVFEGTEEITDATFEYGYDVGPTLSGVTVASNQIRLMHTEQMMNVAGPIRLSDDETTLLNDSGLTLTDAMLLSKDDEGNVRLAIVGGVAAGAEKTLRYREDGAAVVAPDLPLQIGTLMQRMVSGELLRPGEARLIARLEQCPTRLTITPSAQQQQRETVLLAHLRHAPLPPPVPDTSLVPPRRVDPLLDDPLFLEEPNPTDD